MSWWIGEVSFIIFAGVVGFVFCITTSSPLNLSVPDMANLLFSIRLIIMPQS
jgi:hypothetical protein